MELRVDKYLVLCSSILHLVTCCIFPEKFQGQTWYTNIRPSAHTRTAVYFKGSVLEFQDEQTNKDYIVRIWQRRCVRMSDVGQYVVSYENSQGKQTYGCIGFVNRSQSIVQLKVSKADGFSSEEDMCIESNLTLEPWLLVSYPAMNREFTTCPFSGGYNMKIKDKNGLDHGCNFMDLPMRFESECHTGDGITFNFRSDNCIGGMPMSELQNTICIAHWRHEGDVITIIRKTETDELLCLRIPARNTFSGKITVYLFTDIVCSMKKVKNINYFKLELEMIVRNSLCADEHSSCSRLPCSGYFVSQCLKSCGKCDPNVYPTTCDFPRRIRGDWLLNDVSGIKNVNISETRFHVDKIGDFDCVTFPDSPSRKTRHFTTVSFFNNGCRPRYSCVGFKRLSPNSIGFALSQSRTWPLKTDDNHIGSVLCDPDNFHGDPPPVQDYYRTFNDVYKPLVTSSNPIIRQSCTLISSYLFNVTFANRKKCVGTLFQDCNEASHIRIAFDYCPYISDAHLDFFCVGKVEGKYWERIIVMQNYKNEFDTRCLVFSDVDIHRVIMLQSGECDQFSWAYVNLGIRTPMFDMAVTMEDTHCRTVTTTTTTTTHAPEPVNDARRSEYHGNIKENIDSEGDSQKDENTDGLNDSNIRRHHNIGKTTPVFTYGSELDKHDSGASTNSAQRLQCERSSLVVYIVAIATVLSIRKDLCMNMQ